jgi:hypothetical protein
MVVVIVICLRRSPGRLLCHCLLVGQLLVLAISVAILLMLVGVPKVGDWLLDSFLSGTTSWYCGWVTVSQWYYN